MKDACEIRAERLADKTLRISYNYCGICGHVPKNEAQPNYAPIRWWDPDDGWKIGTLCAWCHDEVCHTQPKPGDFAFSTTNGICDSDPGNGTDEDPTLAL